MYRKVPWVRIPPAPPRRNGLRSIQKARPKGRAFLIPLRHSSFSAKGPACCGCSVASALPTPPPRYQPFAGKLRSRFPLFPYLTRSGPPEWTALHSKSPAERPGFSHTAALYPGLCYNRHNKNRGGLPMCRFDETSHALGVAAQENNAVKRPLLRGCVVKSSRQPPRVPSRIFLASASKSAFLWCLAVLPQNFGWRKCEERPLKPWWLGGPF